MEEQSLTVQDKDLEVITKDKVMKYLSTFITQTLSETEKEQFMEIATAYNLNPFKREIYCIPYMASVNINGQWTKERKLSIITGFEVYLKRAERSGRLDGWNVKTTGKIGDGSLRAIIQIFRKDWKEPFEHEIWYNEYKQENKIWKEKPVTMTKKVVMSQGFRLAFSDELGGLPYTPDELPDDMTTENKQSEVMSNHPTDGTFKVRRSDYENPIVIDFVPNEFWEDRNNPQWDNHEYQKVEGKWCFVKDMNDVTPEEPAVIPPDQGGE